MTHRLTHEQIVAHDEQIVAHDEQGERHVVMVTRVSIPGSHLRGPPHYTWNDGQALHLVDAKAGVLECAATGRRLKIADWHG